MSKNLFAFVQAGARTVRVAFQGYGYDHAHTYLTTDPAIMKGDLVVVPYQPKSGAARLSIATILEIDCGVDIAADDPIKYKWVVQRVDTSAYDALLERERKILSMIDKAKRRKAVTEMVENVTIGMGEDDAAEVRKMLQS